jgi:phage shock protein A
MSGEPTADQDPTPGAEEAATSEALEPQPSTPPSAEAADAGYTPDGVPTFESVREKIETRYGTAIGATELAAETPEGRSVEEQYEERQRAAAERLEQIRKSMHAEDDKPQ